MVQRCLQASVEVGGAEVARVGRGLCAFVAAGRGDGGPDVAYIAEKIAHLRVFPAAGQPDAAQGAPRMTASLLEAGGAVLLVPQFTLYGDVRRGRRPDFTRAAPPEDGRGMLTELAGRLRAMGLPVAEGVFGADMTVRVANWGPVTVLLDSARTF